jgi:hypothetical protein
MTSSGTRSYNPAASDLVLLAFSKGCGLSPARLTPEHMRMASHEANLVNSDWGNAGVILWESTLVQLPSAGVQLSAGVSQYTMDPATVALLTVYRETGTGTSTSDITLGPLSTTEFAMLNNKNQPGTPTSYWWDRQITPILNLWPVPDMSATYSLFCRVLLQIQDVVLPAGVTLDMPQRFFDAFTDAMCTRLSRHYAPERYATNMAAEAVSWEKAIKRGGEEVMMNLSPSIGSYYRR